MDECCIEFFVPNNSPSPLIWAQGLVIAIRPPEQLRQPSDVDCDPPRLILCKHLCLPSFDQTSHNRGNTALQAKLDELIRLGAAQNMFVGLEQLSPAEIEEIKRTVHGHLDRRSKPNA
jgi:Low affinity iron permease